MDELSNISLLGTVPFLSLLTNHTLNLGGGLQINKFTSKSQLTRHRACLNNRRLVLKIYIDMNQGTAKLI